MKRLIIDQKLLSIREKFFVKDEMGNDLYEVTGSLFEIPKSFSIRNRSGVELAKVWKKPISFLPKFFLEIGGTQVAVIQKEFTFFKSRYHIEGQGIEIHGNLWDMNFEIFKNGHLSGRVDKEWFKIRDTYAIEIADERDELLTLGIVLAIDYVKKMEANAAAASS